MEERKEGRKGGKKSYRLCRLKQSMGECQFVDLE
jgi:hypothetical protein